MVELIKLFDFKKRNAPIQEEYTDEEGNDERYEQDEETDQDGNYQQDEPVLYRQNYDEDTDGDYYEYNNYFILLSLCRIMKKA